MSYMKAEWLNIQTSRTQFETIPSHDIIEHTSTFTCICNPKIESQILNGSVSWWIIHNSFDETLDESDLEPYNDL